MYLSIFCRFQHLQNCVFFWKQERLQARVIFARSRYMLQMPQCLQNKSHCSPSGVAVTIQSCKLRDTSSLTVLSKTCERVTTHWLLESTILQYRHCIYTSWPIGCVLYPPCCSWCCCWTGERNNEDWCSLHSLSQIMRLTSFSLLSLLPQVSSILVAGRLGWRQPKCTKTTVQFFYSIKIWR